jgi:hypothetical protein
MYWLLLNGLAYIGIEDAIVEDDVDENMGVSGKPNKKLSAGCKGSCIECMD